VATVSHELRTPITPIKGYVEILQARGPNLSEDRRQDMLQTTAEPADHLARLVEDLLLASRISSEPGGSAVVDMRRECTDLAEAARLGRPPTGCAAPKAGWSWSCRRGRWRSTPTPCGWSRCWPT
jgi:signal transduction histidine kinase